MNRSIVIKSAFTRIFLPIIYPNLVVYKELFNKNMYCIANIIYTTANYILE